VRPRRQLGIVGERRADAHYDRVDRRAPAMRQFAAVLAADPLGVPGSCRDLAVERHRGLEQHPRPANPGVLSEGLVEQARPSRELAVGDDHLDALVAEDPEAAARCLLGGVVRGDHHAPDAGLQDGLGARRGLALVAAGLQRHVQGGSAQILQPAGLDRVDLRVGGSVAFVPALPKDRPVAGDDRANDRVGLDGPPPVVRELDGTGEVSLVGLGADWHVCPG